jgi:membrane-associated phospholipid phosphatase
MNKMVVHEGDATEEDREKRKWATAISNVTMPPVIALLMFALINYTVSTGLSFVALMLLTIFFAVFMPLSILIIWERRTHSPDLDVSGMTERNQPLFAATVSFFMGTIVLLLIRAPALTTTIMLGYSVGTLFIFFVNLRWKISAHATGIAGPTVVLLFVFGPWGVLLGLLLPLVIWSRVYLKKHTLAQALAGSVAGFVLAAFGLWLVFVYSAPFAAH